MWLLKAINQIVWNNSSSWRQIRNIWSKQRNTKNLKSRCCYKFQCCYKTVKISYEADSISKFDTDDAQISFQIFVLILRISYYFSKILTEVELERKISKWFHWNLRKKWWWMSVVVISFSNDESACLPNATKNSVRYRHFNWPSRQIS